MWQVTSTLHDLIPYSPHPVPTGEKEKTGTCLKRVLREKDVKGPACFRIAMSCEKEKRNAVCRKLQESVLLKGAAQRGEGPQSRREGSQRKGKRVLTVKCLFLSSCTSKGDGEGHTSRWAEWPGRPVTPVGMGEGWRGGAGAWRRSGCGGLCAECLAGFRGRVAAHALGSGARPHRLWQGRILPHSKAAPVSCTRLS